MKTQTIWIPIILLILQSLLPVMEWQTHGAVIYSTPAGGNWNSSSTWEGGVIPGSSDDVVIRNGATVNTLLGAYTSCSNLTVQINGTLLFNGSGSATLTVYGNLDNQGAIRNGSANLILFLYQNASFSGSEWSNNRVSFQGTAAHQITFSPAKIFTGSNFTVEGTARTLHANTSLKFSSTIVDFNGSTLDMASGCRLSIAGQILGDIFLTGPSNELEMSGGAWIFNSTLTGSTLYGTIRIGSSTFSMNGNITIASGAVLENYGSSHTLYINGSVINNGTVTNTSNNLIIQITGNMIQNGIWNNHETTLSGSADQEVTFATGSVFQGSYFKSLNPLTKTIRALSALAFSGTIIDLASGAAGGIRGNLELPDKGILKVSGNGAARLLSRLNLSSTGTEATLWMMGGAYLQNFSNTCARLILHGIIQAGNSEIYFNNEVRVMDTLINYGSSHIVYVDGDLYNLGYIYNGSNNLEISLTGDMIHHGMQWSNYKVRLTGTGARMIDFAPFSAFSGQYLECATAHDLSAAGDLTFSDARVNLLYSNLNMEDGAVIGAAGSSCWIVNSTLHGEIRLNLSGGAYIQGLTFADSISVGDTIMIYQSNVTCQSALYNTGTLQNQNATAHTLYLNGDFHNAGRVINGAGMGNLTLEIKGNIVNDSTWTNFENRLNGTGDQHIRLNGDKPVNAKCILYSNLGGSNFQWYKNDVLIPGATGTTFTLNQITTGEYGKYYCTSSAGQSRLFTIHTYMAVDFAATPLAGCKPSQVTFTDQTISPYPVQSRYWTFGDQQGSALQNPVHLFQTNGVFDVSLTVSDGYISRKAVKESFIDVYEPPVPSFTFDTVCLGSPTHFTDLSGGINRDTGYYIQYVSAVTGFSSQYTDTIWSAFKVTGPPDVYPYHRDDTNAWASLTANNQREYLILQYPQAVHATKVIVYETLYPGTVDSLYLKNESTGQWNLVWTGTASPQPAEARAFAINFPLTSYLTKELRLALNSPAGPYWNEIDAVALLAPADTFITSQSQYVWDVGENGVTIPDSGSVAYTYQNHGVHPVTLTVTNQGICTAWITHNILVYSPTEGGLVDGDTSIPWGTSTGTMALSGYNGTIIKWQKRVNGLDWMDMEHTGSVYEEIPVSMGTWEYRALVQHENCNPEYASPAIVQVIKPLLVTWNGSLNSDWTESANWTPAYAPDEEISVIIPGTGPSFWPDITVTCSINAITLQPSSHLTISPGAVLTVNGELLLQN